MVRVTNILNGWKNYLVKDEVAEKIANQRAELCAKCPFAVEKKLLYFVKDEFKEIEITFWMDGTDQETEEEIVEECRSVLNILGSIPYNFIFRITTEGEHFYIYS